MSKTNDEVLVMIRNLVKDIEDEAKELNGYIIVPKKMEKLIRAIANTEQEIMQLPDEENPSVLSLMEAHKLLLTENKLLRDSVTEKEKDIVQIRTIKDMFRKQVEELEAQAMRDDQEMNELISTRLTLEDETKRSKKVIDTLLDTIKILKERS